MARSAAPALLSVLLHGALLAFLVRTPPAAAEPAVPAAWAGDTFDLDLVGVEKGSGSVAPAAPPPGEDSQPVAPAPPPAPAPKVVAEAAPKAPPKVASPKEPAPPAGKMDKELDDSRAATAATPSPPQTTARPRAKLAGGAAPGGEAGDGKAKGGTFGAEGPSAARDLGSAFTRAIAPANQADAAWSKLPVGAAGTLEIAVSVDETGHVGDAVPLSAAPPAALLGLVKRTIILLRGGVFHLKGGEATAGRQIIRLRADVSDVDGAAVQGGTIDVAFRYEKGRGKAEFTRPGGRHVEVNVTLVRVEPAL